MIECPEDTQSVNSAFPECPPEQPTKKVNEPRKKAAASVSKPEVKSTYVPTPPSRKREAC